jgi:hypothetical protein
MVSKKYLSQTVLIIISTVCIYANCRKPRNCAQTSYSFEIGARAFPDLDSIRVGDTLWIEINEPVTQQDANTNSGINFSGAANLGTVIGFIELKGNRQSADAANDFDLKLISGTYVGMSTIPSLFREYFFAEENTSYTLRLAVIPKKTGIYRISLSDAANVYRKNEECTKAFFRLNFENTNQHLYFNEQNFGVVVALPNNGYCFKVK